MNCLTESVLQAHQESYVTALASVTGTNQAFSYSAVVYRPLTDVHKGNAPLGGNTSSAGPPIRFLVGIKQDFIIALSHQRLFLNAGHHVIASTLINLEIMIRHSPHGQQPSAPLRPPASSEGLRIIREHGSLWRR